jgi:putative Holliday junction resolvase
MRALGVDLGARRIGLAISDPETRLAFPLDAIDSRGTARDIETLCTLVEAREVERVVVGLPLHLDGRSGPEVDTARRFAGALERAAGVPVELLDERWTSLQAERALRETGTPAQRRKRRRSGDLDSMAATILLRTWLDREKQLGEAGAST